MLNHKFTAREAGVILLLIAVVIGYVYYYVVYQWFENQVASYSTLEIEDEILLEEQKAFKLKKMQAELENGNDNTSILAVYNNQSAEILALNDILVGNANYISITWSDPELTGTIVRRDVTISFTADSYEEAGDLIKAIADCEYTLLIVDMSMNEDSVATIIQPEVTPTPEPDEVPADIEATEEGETDVDTAETAEVEEAPQPTATVTPLVGKKATYVTITVRFFETTDGASNLNGLVQPAPVVTIDDDDDGLPSTAEINDQINGD